MKRKSLFSVATSGLMLAALIPAMAQANDGVINFSGSITDVSCNINGSTPGLNNVTNVNLGTIQPSVFDGAAGKTSPLEPFQLVLSGDNCKDGSKVSIEFDQVGNVDPASGNLKLTGGAASASGVQIQIYNDHVQPPVKIQLGQGESTPQVATITGKTGTLKYKAAYVSTGTVTAGSGISHSRYTLAYQ
ncbi:fimbrial protein [Pseudomonas sp. PH1b]|uniref:fimbrial protein n=1 Tax=Pseudomonas sp. PH1b TaxID=1397282 RepID=UPI00046A0875|nr:fimbrial protein [Pseudomonas sp. PH1b]